MIVNTYSDNFLKSLEIITFRYYHRIKGALVMFSLELKKQRESRGLSQYKLAQQLGVSQATVGMWESGKRDPSFPVLRTICEFFGVSSFWGCKLPKL